MPPKRAAAAAKPAATKTKAPAKVAEPAPKKATPVAKKSSAPAKPVPAPKKTAAAPKKSTTVVEQTKAILPPTSATGTKRKASDDETEAPKPAAKRTKSAPVVEKVPAKAPAPKNAAPAKRAVAPMKKTITKAAPKKAATTTKSNITKPAATKAPAKKASPPAKPTTTKATANKRKAEATESAPAKKGRGGKAADTKKEDDMKATKAKETAAAKAKKAAADKKEETEKKVKAAARPKKVVAPKPPKPARALPIINQPPTTKLDIYVFGANESGELGLGAGKDPNGKSVSDVKRPRLNHNLLADKVGVVQIAVGGMHCVALTADNKILTWGVNDQGALGRPTEDGPMTDIKESDDDSDDDDDDPGMNLNASESTPKEIDTSTIPEGTKFASVYASDSASFAMTTTGLVYGWGSFRGNDGVLGFRATDPKEVECARQAALITELKDVIEMACGTNHVLALTNKGKVFTWGAGEQNQLARRIMARSMKNGLVPREFGMGRKKIVKVAAGDYHSIIVDDKGVKYGWGLNTFSQTGVEKKTPDDDIVMQPTVVDCLRDYDFKQIVGAAHHTMGCTKDNKVLVWGRIDSGQAGMTADDIPKEKVFVDETGKPRYTEEPLELEMDGVCVGTSGDTCIAIDTDGTAWSWGFNENYQTGLGKRPTVIEATEIDNSAVQGKKMVFGGVGGQFGVLAGEPSAENEE